MPTSVRGFSDPYARQPVYWPNVNVSTTIVRNTYVNPPATVGIEPQASEAILYGKDIPLYVGGKIPIGGRICEGPFFGGTQADPTVSFIAYHAHNIGTFAYADTVVTEARLRGQKVWTQAGGYIATDKLPAGKFDWRPGHWTQGAFAQSIARYGSNAIGYTEGIISSWQDIPLKPFGGIVPFPTMLVENSRYGDPADGIPREEAIMRILEYLRIDASEYDVDVSGSDQAWIIASETTLQDLLKQLRSIFVNYQITYTDKVRIIEPPQFSVTANVTNGNAQRESLQFKHTDPTTIPLQKKYTFIDVGRDYEMNTVVAEQDRSPVPTSDASATASIELPIATTSAQAMSDVHISLYEELAVRSQMAGVADSTLFGIECGDGIRFADSQVIDFVGKVQETIHDFDTWSVQFVSGEVVSCDEELDPYFPLVVLLLGFERGAGSTLFIDESEKQHGAATVIGTAQTTTTNPLVGTGSLLLDATADADGICYDDDDDWDLADANADEFTVECFVETTDATPTDSTIIGVWGGGVPNTAWMIYVNTTGNGELSFLAATNANVAWSATPVSSGLSWSGSTRYHIAADKDATGKCRIYRDGVMLGSATPTDSSILGASGVLAVLSIGCNGPAGGRTWPGKIDEVRITKGKARYASDAGFAPPTERFPRA